MSHLNQDQIIKLCGWFLEYSMRHNQPEITNTILKNVPIIKEAFVHPEKDSLLTYTLLYKFRLIGPLPRILNEVFLHLLHMTIVDFVAVHPKVYTVVDRFQMGKLFTALKFLIVHAIAHSTKYTGTDVLTMSQIYFPPILQGWHEAVYVDKKVADKNWSKIYDLYTLSLVEQNIRNDFKETIFNSYRKARKFFKQTVLKHEKFVNIKNEDPTEKMYILFENIKIYLLNIENYISKILPVTIIEKIKVGKMIPNCPELEILENLLKNKKLTEDNMLYIVHIIIDEKKKEQLNEENRLTNIKEKQIVESPHDQNIKPKNTKDKGKIINQHDSENSQQKSKLKIQKLDHPFKLEYETIDVNRDGNCFFESVSIIFLSEGKKLTHKNLRETIITFGENNFKCIKDFLSDITENKSLELWKELKEDGKWANKAGDCVATVASQALQRPIILINKNTLNQPIVTLLNGLAEFEEKPSFHNTIPLVMKRENDHFEPIFPKRMDDWKKVLAILLNQDKSVMEIKNLETEMTEAEMTCQGTLCPWKCCSDLK